jgi:hypothetical protein
MIEIKNEENNPPVALSSHINDCNLNNNEKEIDNELINIIEKERRHFLYEVLMNFNQVRGHKMALAIYILSVMGFYLMIIQFLIILRPLSKEFSFTNYEEICFGCLIFLCTSLGLLFYENVLKPVQFRKLSISVSVITTVLSLLVISFRSHLIFYVIYPLICFFYSLLYFNNFDLWNDYFFATATNSLRNSILFKKNIIHSFFSISAVFLCLNYYIFFYQLDFKKWYYSLTLFLIVNIIICVLSFRIEESALNLKRNNYTNEEIIEHFQQQINKKFKIDEVKSIIFDLFIMIERNEKARMKLVFDSIYKRTTIVLMILTGLLSYIIFGTIFLIPTIIYDQIFLNPMSFVNKIFFFFFLSIGGQSLGAVLGYFTYVPRTYILSYFFSIVSLFSLIGRLHDSLMFACGGIMLFSALVNFSVIYHFTHEIYNEKLGERAYLLFYFTFISSGIFSVVIIIMFYKYSTIGAVNSIMSAGGVGAMVSFLINKDIKVIKKYNL